MFSRFQYVYRIAGRDMRHNLFLVAIDDRNLADITLDNQKKVLPVSIVFWLGRIVFRIHEHRVTLLHQSQRHFRWNRWFHLYVLGHVRDLFLRHDVIEVIHPSLCSKGNYFLQALLA